MQLLKREPSAVPGLSARAGEPAALPADFVSRRGQRASTFLAPARRFDLNSPEWMDRPETDAASLREELTLLEAFNRGLGGHRLAVGYVQRLVRSRGLSSLSVLDLGTGLADTPRALVAWARAQRLSLTVLAVDHHPGILRMAEESCRKWPEIRLEQQNILSMPYGPGSFDLVLCSLALHHLPAADVVRLLRRVCDIAGVGFLVSDLRRNWLAIGCVELGVPLFTGSPIFRHDARQSIRAAFTLTELRAMAQEAGLTNYCLRRHDLVFRMVLEGRK